MEAASNIISRKPVKLEITPAKLWQLQKSEDSIVCRTYKHIPIIKIAPDVIHEIYIANHQKTRTKGWLLGFKDEHLKINIEDIKWESSNKLPTFAFRVRKSSLSLQHYSDMLRSLRTLSNQNIATNYQEVAIEADNQLFTLSLAYEIENDCFKLECGLVYIDVSFQLHTIFPLKIVSTDLSRELAKQKARKFKYGFLTMDQSKRLFPLTLQDELCAKYPLVGVWVTGIENKDPDRILENIKVFQACVKYLTNTVVHTRMSNHPKRAAFILACFGNKLNFYQVSLEVISIQSKPSWKAISSSRLIPIKLPFHDLFLSFGNGNLKLEYPQTSYPPPINPIMRKSADFLQRFPKIRDSTLRSTQSISSSTELISSQFTLTTYSSLNTLNTTISQSTEANLKEQSNLIKQLQLQIANLQTYINKQSEGSPVQVSESLTSSQSSPNLSHQSPGSLKQRYFTIQEEDNSSLLDVGFLSPTIQ